MIKSSLTVLSILISAHSMAFANCNESMPKSRFSGFIVGAHAGVSQAWGKFNTVLDYNLEDDPAYLSSGSTRQTDALVGLLFGYRQMVKNDYIVGVQVDVDYTNNTKLKKTLAYGNPAAYIDANLQKRLTIIPTLVLGKTIAPRLQAFLGLGMGIANFRQKAYNYSKDTTVQQNTTRLGFVPSLSLEYSINQKLALTGSVNWEIYSKVKKNFSGLVPDVDGATYTMAVRPQYSSARIGLIYKL